METCSSSIRVMNKNRQMFFIWVLSCIKFSIYGQVYWLVIGLTLFWWFQMTLLTREIYISRFIFSSFMPLVFLSVGVKNT